MSEFAHLSAKHWRLPNVRFGSLADAQSGLELTKFNVMTNDYFRPKADAWLNDKYMLELYNIKSSFGGKDHKHRHP